MVTKQLLSVEYFNSMNLRNEYISVEQFVDSKEYNLIHVDDANLISLIANDFDVLITTNKHNQHFAYVQIENGVLEIEFSKYRKKIEFKTVYNVKFDVRVIFKNDLNNMFKYNKKTFEKHLDFYNNAYATLKGLNIEYKIGIQNESDTLANNGAFVVKNEYNVHFASFGEFRNIYYTISHDLRKDDNGKFYFIFYSNGREEIHDFMKSEEFISNIEQGKIINIDYFEQNINIGNNKHYVSMAKYNMLRDVISILAKNKYIEDNHVLNVDNDVVIIRVNGDSNHIKINDKSLSVTSDNLSFEMIRKIRTELFKLFKA